MNTYADTDEEYGYPRHYDRMSYFSRRLVERHES
jgi:hypothetical protein